MANYSLVVNSKFQPFSFERYIQPYQIYGEAYKEVENVYGELSQKANVWEEMANEQTDPYAYKMYKTYADDLTNQANQLAREGLNIASRRNLLNLKSRYSKEIVPIEQAYAKRAELAKEQRQATLSNPTMFYQRNASTMSLDDFIKNPSIDYGEKYSGAMLAQQVGQMASNLKTALTGRGKMQGIGLPYQYEQLIQYGYTPAQIQRAITNPREGDPVLNTIVEQALHASGMTKWATPEQLVQARAYANQGLYNAIGKVDIKNFTDNYSMQNALETARENRAIARQQQAAQASGNGFALNPTKVYSVREQEKEADNIKKYSQYFYSYRDEKTGNTIWKMNKAGLAEYRRQEPGMRSPGYSGRPEDYKLKDSDFRKFIDSLGGGKYIGKETKDYYSYNPGQLGNLWAQYLDKHKNSTYDAQKTTEYTYYVPTSDSYQKGFRAKISKAIGSSGQLEEVDYNPKTGKWETVGYLDFADLDDPKKNYTIVSRSMGESNLGSTWFIQKQGEKAKRYRAIPGIHTTAEAGMDVALSNMLEVDRKLLDKNVSEDDKRKYENAYRKYQQQAIMFQSQLDQVNTTKNQEFNNYYFP